MTTYKFQGYPATATAKFTCGACGKPNRKRTFRHECTVNPFNKNDDGSIKSPSEVRAQSVAHANAERDQFMKEPLCAKCEGDLSYTDRKKLTARRELEDAE